MRFTMNLVRVCATRNSGEKSNSKKDNERSNSLQDRRRFLPPLHACISPDVVGFFSFVRPGERISC